MEGPGDTGSTSRPSLALYSFLGVPGYNINSHYVAIGKLNITFACNLHISGAICGNLLMPTVAIVVAYRGRDKHNP